MGLPGREAVGEGALSLLQFCWERKSLAIGKDGEGMAKEWQAECSGTVTVAVAVLVVGATTVLLLCMKLCCGTAPAASVAKTQVAGTAKKKKNKNKKAAEASQPAAPAAPAAAATKKKNKNKNKNEPAKAEPEVEEKATAEERYEREEAEHAAAMKAQFAAPVAANTAGKGKKKKNGGGGGGGGSGGGGGGGSGLSKQQQADLDAGWEVEGAKKKKKGGAKKQTAQVSSEDPNREIKDFITVDARKIGIIIGPKGATLQGLQTATSTKIDTPQRDRDDRSPAKVAVTGRADDVKRCINALQELCDKGYTTLTQDKGFVEQSVSVHPSVLSELIGPGGCIIRALQEKLVVRVTIPETDWRPGRQTVKAKPAKVGVAGAKEACAQAKAVISSIAHYHHHEVTHPGMVHKEIDVPPEYMAFVRDVLGCIAL